MKAFFKNWLEFLDRDLKLSRHQVYAAMLLVMIAGFGLRYGYSLLRERQPRDAEFYIQAVENINSHDAAWFEKYNYYSPLMPRIAACACRIGITPETALHALNMGYAMLWVLVMFFLCRDVFADDKAGLLGMTLAAFNPYSVRMACQILREPLYILLFTISLWCAVKIVRSKGMNLFYPAIIGGLTILGIYTRFEGLEIVLFLPLAVIIILLQHKMQYFRQVAANCVIYFLTVAILIGTLLYAGDSYMTKIPGRFFSTCKLSNQLK